MRVRVQTLVDALTSPPGAHSYRAIIPLIGWEVFRELYDLRKPILDALQKYNAVHIFDGRYIITLIKYGNYVEVDRMDAGSFFLVRYVPVLRGGAEIGMVEPHVWILLLEHGTLEVHEVRRITDVKVVLAKIKSVIEKDGAMNPAALFIDARIRDVNEELLQLALRSIEDGVEYLRGLITDVIAAMFHHAGDVFNIFVERLKERWGPLLEALRISVEDVIVAETKEVARAKAVEEALKEMEELH